MERQYEYFYNKDRTMRIVQLWNFKLAEYQYTLEQENSEANKWFNIIDDDAYTDYDNAVRNNESNPILFNSNWAAETAKYYGIEMCHE